jgi:glycosyltransferase involved in cell wall biosynthesis
VSAPAVSVVIPVRDERENLRPLWEELRVALQKLDRGFEAIFVDDGSGDGSAEALDRLAREDPRIRVFHLEEPSGQSAALETGFRASRGDFVVTIDADLQNDPVDIPLLLDRMGALDLLAGYRLDRRDSVLRRISSRLANRIRDRVTGDAIRDAGCTLKVFRRRCLERILLYDGMHRFLPTLLRLEGYRVGEAPVRHRPRVWGSSKYNVRGRLFRTFVDLLAVRWMIKRRLRVRMKTAPVSERGRSSRAG